MKLDKEEIQKLVLGLLMLLGVIYSYFDMLLFPLQKKQATLRKNIAALKPELQKAQAQIKRTEDLKKQAPEQTAVIASINATIPEGSPVAWFPPRMSELFKGQSIDKVTTKYNTEVVDKEVIGYRRLSWGLDLPKVDFLPFGAAVCALENSEPLLEIASLQIDANRDEIQSLRVAMTAQNLVKQ